MIKKCLVIAYNYLSTIGDTKNIEDVVRLSFPHVLFIDIFVIKKFPFVLFNFFRIDNHHNKQYSLCNRNNSG